MKEDFPTNPIVEAPRRQGYILTLYAQEKDGCWVQYRDLILERSEFDRLQEPPRFVLEYEQSDQFVIPPEDVIPQENLPVQSRPTNDRCNGSDTSSA